MKKTKEEYMAEALLNLKPKAEWAIRDWGETLEWLSPEITPPTQAEIDTEIARLEAEYDAQEYARQRQVEYPTIEDCVHAILDGGLDELQAKRQVVKQKYPKE